MGTSLSGRTHSPDQMVVTMVIINTNLEAEITMTQTMMIMIINQMKSIAYAEYTDQGIDDSDQGDGDADRKGKVHAGGGNT